MQRLLELLREPQALSLLKWIGIIAFFAVVPLLFLKFGEVALREISRRGPMDKFVDEFSSDLPMIMLTFWAGTMGSIISYVYERISRERSSQPLINSMARLLFGGIIGAASFFVIRSAFLIKLLYPKVDTAVLGPDQLVDYRPIVVVAVISGLIAPTLVRGIRKTAGKA